VVSGSCRAELAEEAPEGPDVPLDESSVVVQPEDVQELIRPLLSLAMDLIIT
jgi:hypothetical protein